MARSDISCRVYANLSEVVRAGLRKLMDEEGATAFYLLRQDIASAVAEPTIDVDLHDLLLGPRD
jgi:antitoxin ParD1/3/4